MVLPSHFNYRFHKPKNCTPTKKYHPAKCTPQKKTSAPSCVSRWPLQRNGCRLAGRSISCWVCPCHLDCQSASLVGGFRSPTPLYTPLKFDDENRYIPKMMTPDFVEGRYIFIFLSRHHFWYRFAKFRKP